jgi:uncharacterized membrane protein
VNELRGNTKSYKTVTAFVLSVAVLIWTELSGKEEWGTLNTQDWLTIVIPAVLVTAGVWVVPNPPRN